jgi:RNA recognition motif-containing protein
MELGWGDIWKIFVKFGSVSDVYIPKKVDKWGRKFGFVKFKDVRDADEMFKKLQEVWYGTTKLSVKRARFGKEDQKEEDSGTKTVLPR